MKKLLFIFLSLFVSALFVNAQQNNGPKQITTHNGAIVTIYQPQPESLTGNKLSGCEVVSVRNNTQSEPVFATVWFEATLSTNRDIRMVSLENVTVKNIKFADQPDATEVNALKKLIETELPKWNQDIAMDKLLVSIEDRNNTALDKFSTAPPKIIYKNTLSALIVIDGEPIIKQDNNLKMERVFNTPYLIIKNADDNNFYLPYGNFWYKANNPTAATWDVVTSLPVKLHSIDRDIKEQNKVEAPREATGNRNQQNRRQYTPAIISKPVDIVVSTTPAELLCSEGELNFRPMRGTSLLYAVNTDNQLFKTENSETIYLLLSGRWYTSTAINGGWAYLPADKLPADFVKLTEGSMKDGILANIAGTTAAKEAKIDAQLPQTAKVNRKTASCIVSYDGQPKFEKIEGTNLELAANTPFIILKSNDGFYCVENGVWFFSKAAVGPWSVATQRPADVDKIPSQCWAYNAKYVYIYEVTPDFIYTGYTPGYLGCYIDGSTIVYGTGFNYRGWSGTNYYPRPVTWGFNFGYNPWNGWTMGFGARLGLAHISTGKALGDRAAGWFGPSAFHPAYRIWGWNGGYYSDRFNINNNALNTDYTANLYNYRRDVVVSPSYDAPTTDELWRNTTPILSSSNQANTMYADKNGTVYQLNPSTNEWSERRNNTWKPVDEQNKQLIEKLNEQIKVQQRGELLGRINENQRRSAQTGNERR